MINQLLKPEIKKFIKDHENHDPFKLSLQGHLFPDLPVKEIAEQIKARQKAKQKIPEWYNHEDVIFPPASRLEQSSSQTTAKFKANLFAGNKLIDLSGGTGVDVFYLAKKFKNVEFVEVDQHLCALASHNFRILKQDNIRIHHQSAESFLKNDLQVDLIYLDPSRKANGRKVFKLEDSSPNIIDLLDTLKAKATEILLKTSPWLDIKGTIKALGQVEKVWVLSVNNDCKEVIYLLRKNTGEPLISAVNILPDDSRQELSFTYSQEENMEHVAYHQVMTYLYEPNVSILKSGAFKTLGHQYKLYKLSDNSHLYTSEHLNSAFPGKILQVLKADQFTKKRIKDLADKKRFNIISRNFPLSVPQLVQKFKLKEGGLKYLIFTTDQAKNKLVIQAKRVDL
ncbi:MAG: THUMP-like domain-containing protein [Candidatus Cyclobacteriaceae bacterium M3_2C_046]